MIEPLSTFLSREVPARVGNYRGAPTPAERVAALDFLALNRPDDALPYPERDALAEALAVLRVCGSPAEWDGREWFVEGPPRAEDGPDTAAESADRHDATDRPRAPARPTTAGEDGTWGSFTTQIGSPSGGASLPAGASRGGVLGDAR